MSDQAQEGSGQRFSLFGGDCLAASLHNKYIKHVMHLPCRYVRPTFIDPDQPPQLHIVQGRHPVLDVAVESTVVPNDTNLTAQGPRALVITGPNMGGKSCYMRQAALIAIMAQVGLFWCPMPRNAAFDRPMRQLLLTFRCKCLCCNSS